MWLQLVERTAANYEVGKDGSDGFQVCFVEQDYASGGNGCQLDGFLVRITDVFLPYSENRNMSALFHPNHGYSNEEKLKPIKIDFK